MNDEFRDYPEDYKRLSLLQNAVIHYGGGISDLQRRIQQVLSQRNSNSVEVTELLSDISVYLRDVIKAGLLDENDYLCHQNDIR